MRIAIVSDVHGNLTALEAVIADLAAMAPDLVLHGGDLAAPGASPVEVVDRIRDLGWPGVFGNTDEMLWQPQALTDAAAAAPAFADLFARVAEMAAWTRDQLGDARLAWLRALPAQVAREALALVHAAPGDAWRAPPLDAAEEDLRAVYGPLNRPLAIYGHLHVPGVRVLEGLIVANSGSAGQPYDGDPRASYLLVDAGHPSVRRVAYDVDGEMARLRRSALPHAEWMVRTLASARPQMP